VTVTHPLMRAEGGGGLEGGGRRGGLFYVNHFGTDLNPCVPCTYLGFVRGWLRTGTSKVTTKATHAPAISGIAAN
jgi:hypothetical protein